MYRMGGACFRRLGQENLLLGTHTFDGDNADEPCDEKQRMHSAGRQTPIMFVRILEGGTGAASLASDEIIAAY